MNVHLRWNLPPVAVLSLLVPGLLVVLACPVEAGPPTTSPPLHKTAKSPKNQSKSQSQRQARHTALSASLVIKVADPAKVRRRILKLIKKSGGHPALMTDSQLNLKVPPKQLSATLAVLGKAGHVLDKKMSRADMTEQIARLRGRLRSKTALLARLRGFLDDSGVGATLKIERTMQQLVREIEGLKGRLRLAVSRSTMADVRIRFQYRNPTQLRYVRSPFGWINSVDVHRFLREF
ncbi:MAG: DUF4349 domain-containing protein [Myxococcales bacterium]|nr:DUF4349 domain-containing protein [Myxococcales bacterium]